MQEDDLRQIPKLLMSLFIFHYMTYILFFKWFGYYIDVYSSKLSKRFALLE